jgi:hypothetical protein
VIPPLSCRNNNGRRRETVSPFLPLTSRHFDLGGRMSLLWIILIIILVLALLGFFGRGRL